MLAVTLQEQLNAFYDSAPPRSCRHDGVEWTFAAAGHAISIERRDEWTAEVTRFLRS